MTDINKFRLLVSNQNNKIQSTTFPDTITSVANNLNNVQGPTGASLKGPTGPKSTIDGPQGMQGIGATAYIELIDTPDNLSDTYHAIIVNSGATGLSHTNTSVVMGGTGLATGKYSASINGGNATANYHCDINSSGDVNGQFIFRANSIGKIDYGNYVTAINSTFNSASGKHPVIIQSSGGTINCGSNSSIVASTNSSVLSDRGSIFASKDVTVDAPLSIITASDTCSIGEYGNSSRCFIGGSLKSYIGKYQDVVGSSFLSCKGLGGSNSVFIDGNHSVMLASTDNTKITGDFSSICASSDNISLSGNYCNIASSTKSSIDDSSIYSNILSSIESTIIGSKFSTINSSDGFSEINNTSYASIISSSSSYNSGKFSTIIGSENCNNLSNYCEILASTNCEVKTVNKSSFSTIIGSLDSDIQGTDPKKSTIIGSKNSKINNSTASTIVSSNNCYIDSSKYSMIIASESVTNTGDYSVVICGTGPSFNNSSSYSFRVPILAYDTLSILSDKNLKKDITKINFDESLLNKVEKLETYKFHFQYQNDKFPKEIGFIAQEIQNIFPNMIRDRNIKRTKVYKNNHHWYRENDNSQLNKEDIKNIVFQGNHRGWVLIEQVNPDWLGIDYSQVFLISLECIKILKKDIDFCKQKINHFKNL